MRRRIFIVACVLTVVCCVSESAAGVVPPDVRNIYGIRVAGHDFGIAEFYSDDEYVGTIVGLGPLGHYEVPFTARQGLAGAMAAPILIATLVYGVIRLITRRAHSEGADDAGRS